MKSVNKGIACSLLVMGFSYAKPSAFIKMVPTTPWTVSLVQKNDSKKGYCSATSERLNYLRSSGNKKINS